MITSRSRHLVRHLTLLAAVCGGLSTSLAAEPGLSTQAVGAWDLKLDNGSRQCRMMLRADVTGPGYALGMPVACHLAFPFLTGVKMWNDVGDGKVQLEDAKGHPLLAFDTGTDGQLAGMGPEGEALRFEAAGPHRTMILKTVSKASDEARARTTKAEAPKALRKLPLPSLAEMAGHYSVLRALGKDTGCMVTLDDKTRGPNGSLKANLAPACRDQGIVIFDPVGWQLEAGGLVLTARKGHSTKLDPQPDGSWTKDTPGGKSLSLKKM